MRTLIVLEFMTFDGVVRADLLVEVSKLAREGRFDYLLVESTGILEPLPVAEPHLGRRTVLTFPLLPPPQKN
jgi:G3E family GTPase